MLPRAIGRVVEAARKRAELSLAQLAEATSLDQALIVEVEAGSRLVSTSKLDRIASVLGLDAFALRDGQDVQQGLVVLPRHAARPDFRQEDLAVFRQAL